MGDCRNKGRPPVASIRHTVISGANQADDDSTTLAGHAVTTRSCPDWSLEDGREQRNASKRLVGLASATLILPGVSHMSSHDLSATPYSHHDTMAISMLVKGTIECQATKIHLRKFRELPPVVFWFQQEVSRSRCLQFHTKDCSCGFSGAERTLSEA